MSASNKTVLLCAAGYLTGSIVGSYMAGSATNHQEVVLWRLAVWVLSAVIFGAHIFIERVRRGSSPQVTARAAASGVALGAFAVALAALIRGLVLNSHNSGKLALALIIFPLAAGLPAFAVAWLGARVIRPGHP
jgi:hypothetical protein